MARTLLKEKEKRALAARARMAKRARRARFFKENKKRLTIIVLAFFVLSFLAFFTPWGPDYYYSDIQLRKFQSPSVISTGVCRDLYKLGWFYSVTFRKDQAQEMYNEIGEAYYGFKLTDFAVDPRSAEEKRFQAQRRIKRGESHGPPYQISDTDLPYVGFAIWRTADLLMDGGPREFPRRLYNNLYMDDFYANNPSACEPAVTEKVKMVGDRLAGRR